MTRENADRGLIHGSSEQRRRMQCCGLLPGVQLVEHTYKSFRVNNAVVATEVLVASTAVDLKTYPSQG